MCPLCEKRESAGYGLRSVLGEFLRGPARRGHGRVSVGPADSERVRNHGASPSNTSPADRDGRDYLEHGIVGRRGGSRARNSDSERDRLTDLECSSVLREGEASLWVLPNGRVGCKTARSYNYGCSVPVADGLGL